MAASSLKLFAVVHLSLEDEWEEEVFFIGTQSECLDWILTNCSSDSGAGFLDFWYGSKRVEVCPLLEGGHECS